MRFVARSLIASALAVGALALPAARVHAGSLDAEETTCAPLDLSAVKALKVAVKHAYRPSTAGCSLVVDVAACGAPSPTEIVYASGFGHSWGTTLTITSLRREGSLVQVTRLVLMRGASKLAKYGGEHNDAIEVRRGAIDGAKIDEALAVAEVAHALTLREAPPAGDGLSFGGWFSSADLAASITLVGPGTDVDRSFVGYSSSDSQLTSLPLSVAIDRLDAAIPPTSLSSSSFDASARALFAAELVRRAPDFDEQFHWWVREAFVRAAGDGGDLSLVPLLRRYLVSSDPSSGARTRIAAISSLAALTGVDLRFDAAGGERAVATVALEYAKMLGSK